MVIFCSQSECDLYGFLSIEGDIVVLISPVVLNPSVVQVSLKHAKVHHTILWNLEASLQCDDVSKLEVMCNPPRGSNGPLYPFLRMKLLKTLYVGFCWYSKYGFVPSKSEISWRLEIKAVLFICSHSFGMITKCLFLSLPTFWRNVTIMFWQQAYLMSEL